MRVRKAVPEGYKTCNLADYHIRPSSNPRSNHSSEHSLGHPLPGLPNKFSELAPFCGIHKVGGHAFQPSSSPALHHLPELGFDDDGSSFTGSSQGSQSSTMSDLMPPTLPDAVRSQKRRYDDPDDDDDGEPQIFEDADMLTMRSRTNPASHLSVPDTNSIRPMAYPTTRRKHHIFTPRKMYGLEGQENASLGTSGTCPDFGEADFLHPPSDDLFEVEMGGV
jgi:hypothetical protein